MPVLLTKRLVLLPLSREMIEQRLAHEEFDLHLDTPDGPLKVHFPAEWPGDPLAFFPALLEHLGPEQQEVDRDGSFTAITREAPEAVGQLGRFRPLSEAGEIEIGYGMNPNHWGKGYATEAVGALVEHLLTLPDIRSIKANTSLSNRPSERVLEKLGFARTGTDWSAEDGDLTVWSKAVSDVDR